MANPTPVNSQITDAVTPANVKVVAEAPAFAMGAIFQNMAHATGILYENAVAAQQQQNTLAQAATNQGVMQIYTMDTTATPSAAGTINQTGVADNLTSLLTALRTFDSPSAQAASSAMSRAATTQDKVDAPASRAAKQDGYDGIANAVKDAARFANDTVLGSAEAFSIALRQCTDSFVYAIERVQATEESALRRILLDAAMAATLRALLQQPQRAREYEEVLQVIKRLE